MDSMPPGEPEGLDPKGKRWYPTCTTFSDGRILVLGGDAFTDNPHYADIPLIFDVTQPPGIQYAELAGAELHLPYYGFNFQLSDGTVLYAGSKWAEDDPGAPDLVARKLDIMQEQWSDVAASTIRGGSAVMYEPDLVMKAGAGQHRPGIKDVLTLDASAPSPGWVDDPAVYMIKPRADFYLVTLPDGNILAVGGEDDLEAPVWEAEIHDREVGAWTLMAPMTPLGLARTHHASAVLLPDARVLIAAGMQQKSAQIYRPPYLYDAQGTYLEGSNRPQIASVNGPIDNINRMYYGQQVVITMASAPQSVAMVSLIRLGSATHHFDQNQRFISLNVNAPVAGQPPEEIRVDAPANGNLAPPGYYMLFVVDTISGRKVPSVSQMVRLGFDCQGNGIVDFEDIDTSSSPDANANGIPDECDPSAPLPAPYPHDRRKNRYISFDPNKTENDGKNIAFKVVLNQLTLGSCDGNGGFCRTDRGDADCNMCSIDGNPCLTGPIDCAPSPVQTCVVTGETCVNDAPDIGGENVNRTWWVGPESPMGNGVHLMVTRLFRKISTDWPNPIHVGDCEIVPQAVYGVTAVETPSGAESGQLVVNTTALKVCDVSEDLCNVDGDCPAGESCVPAGSPAPFWWGDVVGVLAFHCNGDIREQTCDPNTSNGDCTGPGIPAPCCTVVGTGLCDCPGGDPCARAWELPNGVTNADDVTAALWTSAPAPPTTVPADFTWVDVHGNGTFVPGSQAYDPPNLEINVSDLQQIISAWGGFPYKFYDPKDCPSVPAWPDGPGELPGPGAPEFTLVAGDDLLDPTDDLVIDVFVSEASNVAGHELALEVTGGTAGTLAVTDISVDTTRTDYLYYDASQAPLEMKQLSKKRIGAVVQSLGEGMTKTGPAYLATYTFQPTGGATGVFEINVRGQGKSFLLSPNGSTQVTRTSGAVVVAYGVDCLYAVHCDDNQECSIDTCTANNECQYAPVAAGTACDDGLWCTLSGSTCDGNGLCTGGQPRCQPGELCLESTHTCQPDLPPLPE